VKPGDLVQSNIFNDSGSGGYGLVKSRCKRLSGYWNIDWCSEQLGLSHQIVGIHEVHETQLVVVAEA
jgi:hypothetical protein